MIPDHYIIKLAPGQELEEIPPALRLLRKGASLSDLTREAEKGEGPDSLALLFYWIGRLAQMGRLEYFYRFTDRSSVCLRGVARDFILGASRLSPGCQYLLSCDCFLRCAGEEVRLESATSEATLSVNSRTAVSMISHFAAPIRPEEIPSLQPGIDARDVLPFTGMLLQAGFIEPHGATAGGAKALWEFHDLLFHRRSSVPRAAEAFGGLDPPRSPEPPLRKPAASADAVVLHTPDLDTLIRKDPPFTSVVESRRSTQSPGAVALTLAQLSEFLFRTAHYRQFPRRPLPGAGARGEIEFYAAVHRCEGLEPCLYHYDAVQHRLYRLADSAGIVDEAGRCWAQGDSRPDVVIVVAARFGRMASRYAAIAYRNILLDAGIAMHAMYLVATVMGLAPCALGLNVPSQFQKATGLDPFEETSIALFALSTTAGHA